MLWKILITDLKKKIFSLDLEMFTKDSENISKKCLVFVN